MIIEEWNERIICMEVEKEQIEKSEITSII